MPYLINTDVPVGSALNRLGSLIDVEINNPLSKDVLSYDPTTNTWVNDDAIGNIVSLTQAEYDALTQDEKMDSKKYYYITDDTITGAPVDDDDVSPTKVWSSQKVDGEIDSLNSALGGVSMVVLGADDFTINSDVISFKNATYAAKVVGAHIVTTNGYFATGIRSVNGVKTLRAAQANTTGATILSSLANIVSVLVFLQN